MGRATTAGAMSTPLTQTKPPPHSSKLPVMPPSAKPVVPLGVKKAQVPAQIVARSSAVVGAWRPARPVVTAFGALTAVTVVPGATAPMPAFTVISIGGSVTAGWLDVDGR